MCIVFGYICFQITQAYARNEFANVDRLLEERERHACKCFQCATAYVPLYVGLWSNSKVITYDEKNNHPVNH